MANSNCDMPDCVGGTDSPTKACRDPSGELVEMCEGCLSDGWRPVVTVVES